MRHWGPHSGPTGTRSGMHGSQSLLGQDCEPGTGSRQGKCPALLLARETVVICSSDGFSEPVQASSSNPRLSPGHSCFWVLSPQEGNNPQALPRALLSGSPGRGDRPQQTPPQLQASSTRPLRAERIPRLTPRPQPESRHRGTSARGSSLRTALPSAPASCPLQLPDSAIFTSEPHAVPFAGSPFPGKQQSIHL